MDKKKDLVRILVVDDDIDLLEMVTLMLEKQGYHVHAVSNGSGLDENIHKAQPHLILMDIFLGDHDGRVLCQSLKASDSFSKLPVILYSAGNTTQASIRESRADAFFSKPFNISDLFSEIRRLTSADTTQMN